MRGQRGFLRFLIWKYIVLKGIDCPRIPTGRAQAPKHGPKRRNDRLKTPPLHAGALPKVAANAHMLAAWETRLFQQVLTAHKLHRRTYAPVCTHFRPRPFFLFSLPLSVLIPHPAPTGPNRHMCARPSDAFLEACPTFCGPGCEDVGNSSPGWK